MAASIWSKALAKGLAAVASTVGVLTYKINKDLCYADAPQASGIPWDHNWDKLVPTAKRNLFLIRHGEYNDRDSELPLTPLGLEQAKITGLRLNELGLPYTRMVHSTMLRAAQTAGVIRTVIKPMPVFQSDLIREGVPVRPDPETNFWRPSERQLAEGVPRLEAAFHEYIHRADSSEETDVYEIIVCHANVIRFFVCKALQVSPAAWLRFTLHNCSITWIVILPDGRVEVKAIGDCGHIPQDKLTT